MSKESGDDESVRVIFTIPTENAADGLKYRPLRVMPVSNQSLIGKHYTWDFIQKQIKKQNQIDNKNCAVKFFGKYGNGSLFALKCEDDYLAALKIAEVNEEALDVVMMPLIFDESSDSENEPLFKNRQQKRQSLISDYFVVRKGQEEKESNISNAVKDEQKPEELKPLWFDALKNQIKKEVTQDVVSTLITALQQLETNSNTEPKRSAIYERRDHSYSKVCAAEASEVDKQEKTTEEVIHSNIICDSCEKEIRGIRYKCAKCEDYDLCQKCEVIPDVHIANHNFLKIKKPIEKKNYAGEDIILSLDVDLPTGRTEVKDIRFVPNHKKSAFKSKCTKFMEPFCDSDARGEASTSKSVEFTRDASVRPKHIERKVAELNKKVEKLSRVKGQSLEKQLSQTSSSVHESKHRTEKSKLLFLGGIVVSEDVVVEGPRIQAGSKFKKVWKVRNTGTKSWNSRTTVRFCWGNSELEPLNKTKEVSVPPLKPGQEGRITIRFAISKSCTYGFYHSHWRLLHRGQPFGQRLVCKVFIDPNDDKCLEGCNCTKCGYEIKAKHKIGEKGANLAAAITAVREIGFSEDVPMKANVKSHTATPTNTPFDISPPKSPEPSSLIALSNEAATAAVNPTTPVSTPSSDFGEKQPTCGKDNEGFENDSLSAFSLSSSESADEFVVVPLPRCFDLTTPFSCANGTFDEKSNYAFPDGFFTEEGDHVDHNALNDRSPRTLDIDFLSTSNPGDNANVVKKEEVATTAAETVPKTNVADEQLLHFSSYSENNAQQSNVNDVTEPEPATAPVENVRPEEHSGRPSNADVQESKETKKENNRNGVSTNPFLSSPQQSQPENMIHVLPESIVNGALNAAAHVVQNVSRALFSAQSLGSHDNYNWITSPPPAAIPLPHQLSETKPESTAGVSPGSTAANGNGTTNRASDDPKTRSRPSRLSSAMSQLFEMGFWNQKLNEELLEKHNYDVNNAVEDLLNPGRQESTQAGVVSTQPRQGTPRTYAEFD